MSIFKNQSAQAAPVSFISLMGGETVIKKPIRSDFDIISLSNEGVTKASLDAVISHLGISKKSFSENILDTSIKTIERKKSTDKLDKRTSSHVIEIAKI